MHLHFLQDAASVQRCVRELFVDIAGYHRPIVVGVVIAFFSQGVCSGSAGAVASCLCVLSIDLALELQFYVPIAIFAFDV